MKYTVTDGKKKWTYEGFTRLDHRHRNESGLLLALVWDEDGWETWVIDPDVVDLIDLRRYYREQKPNLLNIVGDVTIYIGALKMAN